LLHLKDKPTVAELAGIIKDSMGKVLADPKSLTTGEPVAPMDNLWDRLQHREEPRLRMSFGAKCARQKWYQHHEPDKATSPGLARVSFSMGDLWEVIGFRALEEAVDKHPRLSVPKEYAQQELTMNVDGHLIAGHTDGCLLWDGEPFVVLDFKQTGKWAFNKWEGKRIPPEVWGYRNQAANYMAALRNKGHNVQGFLWLVHLKDVNGFETGWATWDELKPYHKDSMDTFARAIQPHPPARCAGFPDAVPCAGKTRKYCPFFDHCSSDRG
jgi:hypothetical protein